MRSETVISGFNIIGCDALNMGSKDFAAGLEFVLQMKELANFPFISSNITDDSGSLLFESYVILDKLPFSYGVTGVATSLPAELKTVGLADVETSVNNVLAEMEEKSDFQIVLFNGTYEEAVFYRPKFTSADYMFISGDTHNPIGKMKNPEVGPRMYRLGKQGKSMAMITLNVENPDLTLADITELKLREEFIQRQLVRMNKDEPSKSLEDIYADQPPMLDRISQIREALKETQKELTGVINSSRFDFPPMDRSLDDEPQMLGMITKTLTECDQLAAEAVKSTGS